MTLRCSYCGTLVNDGAERCPKCLRKSSLTSLEKADVALKERALDHLWPSGSTCPLCGERDVGDGVFFLQLTKGAQSLDETASRWLSARGRCCAPCQTNLRRLEIGRWVALAGIPLGILASYGLASLVDRLGLERAIVPSLFVGLVASLVLPLVIWRMLHNHVRGAVDKLWVVDVLRAGFDAPEGIPIYDLVNIHAKLKNDKDVVDLERLHH